MHDPIARTAPAEDIPVLALRPRDAARVLSISARLLWQLTRDGFIPCVRLGRAVRYDPADLKRFIEVLKART